MTIQIPPPTHNVRLQMEYWAIGRLKPDANTPRTHSAQQRRSMTRSIQKNGMLLPFLVSGETLITGQLRLEVCKALGFDQVPVVRIEHLTAAQLKAFQIAENRLGELGGWDKQILGEALLELSLADIELEDTGFEIAEIDLLIEGLGDSETQPDKDDLPVAAGPEVTRVGDLWIAGPHRLICASALERETYRRLMGEEKADAVIADPPYNTPARMIGGRGRIKHPNFAMAAGEMSDVEFTAFLTTACTLAAEQAKDGSIAFWFMDWRHIQHLLSAGAQAYDELKNLCVWAKTQPGQGAFYRSQHELVGVFKKGSSPHRNNIQLGKFGRGRSNVWTYSSPAAFAREGEEGRLLESHATPKPVALIMDAILDVTARGEAVLDPFIGGGASLIAAERSGRRCFGIELEPRHIDACLRRIRRHGGIDAVRQSDGRSFSSLEEELGHERG
jgi:DNA modification methylase